MPTRSIEKSQNLESTARKKGRAKPNAPSRRKARSGAADPKKSLRSAAKPPVQAEEPRGERITKQERMLTLLSQPAGASIQEMMEATNWQQHSVRRFLAGTVKRKLGFALTSLKPDGGIRRYRIETRRGR